MSDTNWMKSIIRDASAALEATRQDKLLFSVDSLPLPLTLVDGVWQQIERDIYIVILRASIRQAVREDRAIIMPNIPIIRTGILRALVVMHVSESISRRWPVSTLLICLDWALYKMLQHNCGATSWNIELDIVEGEDHAPTVDIAFEVAA